MPSAIGSQLGMNFKMHVLRVEVLMLQVSCGPLLACGWLAGKAVGGLPRWDGFNRFQIQRWISYGSKK